MDAQQLTEQKAALALKQIGSLSKDLFALEELIVKLQVQLAAQKAEIAELRLEVESNTRAIRTIGSYHA
jgi:predicted  nucleic acid-binding Zn-ribbon protein